ncbi:DMT family transporter [Candidatus Xianfuyuplasma coldseepsis]|uniref:DMT family transporter n=1 Tax=Candidatus Xianfuyuplasma coldseepsis TaxID=2782163 RepID=A0A7L7KSM6_9MOLU|nr:DMT family transporter [Xianfuyuplasma coldseepsis]QMS85821.1 DMT family transporter [Xianfuyuplasma coldseepsis]
MGELISLGTAFCWTFTVLSFEAAGKKVGSLSVNFIRLLFGFVFISIFLYITRGYMIPIDASSHTWNWMLLSGVIGFVIGDYFLFQAFVDVGGRISLVIYSMVPPITAILGLLYFDEYLSVQNIIGMTITIAAIILVVIYKEEDHERHPHRMRGALFAMIGAVAQAVGLLFSKIGMGDYSAFAATQIRIIAAIVGFALIITMQRRWPNIKQAFFNKRALVFIIIGSIFGPFLGVSSSLLALQYTSLGIATTISQMNIIFIIPFSLILFKERVNAIEIIGSIVALIGVSLLFL